ncbi:MAG TPA: site-2 protease family protein [Candidatus Methanoperedenaceae archaeon]|nr:site-2 protease family protein [Candidatus Methanoperedenaceae archaeon]
MMNDDEINALIHLVQPVFSVYEVRRGTDFIILLGTPKEEISGIQQFLWSQLSHRGYQSAVKYELGENVIVISRYTQPKDKIWINVALAVATFFTTMVAGASMFGVGFEGMIQSPQNILRGLPFTLAVMLVLGSHEMGHYFMARRYGMRTSLPYFIPFPLGFGTMGAVIQHRGLIPDRKALFDVGVAGPVTGIVMSVIVTLIGLSLEPPNFDLQGDAEFIYLELPPLFQLMTLFVQPKGAVLHPVAVAGWIGMFVTAMNLIPAGQLDGGHVLRAMIGRRAAYVSSAFPFILIVIGFIVTYFMNGNGSLWVFWGLFLSFFAAAGHPSPVNDNEKLDLKRIALGVLVFAVGLLCITLVPFQMPA